MDAPRTAVKKMGVTGYSISLAISVKRLISPSIITCLGIFLKINFASY
jgi:hypothetical protein